MHNETQRRILSVNGAILYSTLYLDLSRNKRESKREIVREFVVCGDSYRVETININHVAGASRRQLKIDEIVTKLCQHFC